MNKDVTAYIEKQVSPQKEICTRLRNIILKAFPKIREEMKLGVPYYNDKYYLVALKDHVNMGFSIKGLTPAQTALFRGTGATVRVLEFYALKEIDKTKIIKLMKMIR